MGSAYSQNDGFFNFKVVENEDFTVLKDADEIMDAIKASRRKIKERIEFLEIQVPQDIESDKEIAILIRQDQYLEVLQNKPKAELAKIFLSSQKDNCIYPEILQWYQPPEENGG